MERERARVPPDALAQRPGERRRAARRFYLRDEETGHFWSPTPLPAPRRRRLRHPPRLRLQRLRARRGRHPLRAVGVRGHRRRGEVLGAEGAQRVGPAAPALGHRLRGMGAGRPAAEDGDARDHRDRAEERRAARAQRLQHRVPGPRRLLRRRRRRPAASPATAPSSSAATARSRNPAAMARARLSGKVGAALDPCARHPGPVRAGRRPGARDRLPARRGPQCRRRRAASSQRFRGPAAARGALDAVRAHWKRTLGAVQVETPDASLNVLANGWLLYQTLACRLWARSGYYQSGGAFGFRDQLQDAMALVHAEPAPAARAPAALRRPPVRRGRRPALVASAVGPRRAHALLGRLSVAAARDGRYVTATGDTGVLDEPVHVPRGPPGERRGTTPTTTCRGRSAESASALRALRARDRARPALRRARPAADGLRRLERRHEPGRDQGHGRKRLAGLLPLRRADAVRRGRATRRATRRSPTAARRRRSSCAATSSSTAGTASGTGARTSTTARRWARRATTSARSTPSRRAGRCSRARATPQRSRMAMNAVDERLVRRDHALIQLLDPPFDKSTLDPGYIRGYVPGVRENGGQYTHGAIWAAMAFAALGDRERAWELATMINPVNHARHAGGRWRPTRSSRTWSPPTSTRWRRTPAAAAGAGTRARPDGCTGSSSNRCSG